MKQVVAAVVLSLMASNAMSDDDAAAHAADFARKATISNLFEIEAAKIEVAKGQAVEAKQFAQDMLKDHGKAGELLSDAADEDGIKVPSEMDAAHLEKLNALSNSDPANLDQAYLSTQVTAHEDAFALFEKFSKDGPNGQLKRTAAKIVPDLHMHLTRVKGLTSK